MPAMEKEGYHTPIKPLDLILGYAGCHSSFVNTYKEVAEETGTDLQTHRKTSKQNQKNPTRELMEEVQVPFIKERYQMKTKMNVSKKTQYRWFVLALIFCVYMVAGADRSNIGMVVPFIKKSFELTNTDIGAMASFFYLTYAVIQIPAGHLYSKKGVRGFYSISFYSLLSLSIYYGTR